MVQQRPWVKCKNSQTQNKVWKVTLLNQDSTLTSQAQHPATFKA